MIKQLEKSVDSRWDAFVEKNKNATFFHKAGWKSVIENAFGHDTYYFYAEEAGEIVGILPLVHIKSVLFGNALHSTAFCVYGGVVADSEECGKALNDKASELARQLNVDYLETRNRYPTGLDLPKKDLYVTFRKTLAEDDDANLNAIPRKQRAMIRKGIKLGLSSEIDKTVDRFYANYSESVRNLGTPVFSKRYFELLKQEFKNECEILTVLDNQGNAVSSVMSFYFKDEVLPYYGGGSSLARSVHANDFMYWEVMRRAREKGIKIFDFGRSKVGTGSYRFKIHWGFEPQPLFYEYLLVNTEKMPDINPLNPKYQIFIAIWKRLPLKVSQTIGPFLAQSLG